MRRLCPAIGLSALLVALLAWARPACAITVAIVSPPNPPPDVTEALSRLHGELLSVGLEVTVVGAPDSRRAGADSIAWVEQLTAESGASAVIDILADGALFAVDVWTVKKAPRVFEVTRVAAEADSANPPERLALRAIEALRGSLLEVDLAARERQEPKAETSEKAAATGTPAVASAGLGAGRFGLELGAAGLMSLDGVGAAVMPLVRAGWAAYPWLSVEATLAGLGTRPTVATAGGNARVAQQYGVLGGSFRLRSDRTLWPFVTLAAGALRTSVAGEPGPGTTGHTAVRWAVLIDGSLGVGMRLRSRCYATVAVHVQMAEPYVAVHSTDGVAATTGRPNLLLTLTVGAWL